MALIVSLEHLLNVVFANKSHLVFQFFFFFFFWGGEGLTSDFASNPVHKQKFCTRLTRPGVNARVSGPECYAPPRLGSPAFLITGLLCNVSLKNSEPEKRVFYIPGWPSTLRSTITQNCLRPMKCLRPVFAIQFHGYYRQCNYQ